MTFHELLEVMQRSVVGGQNHEVLDRLVVVRLGVPNGDDDEDLYVGWLVSAVVDAGCTDELVLVLDAEQGDDLGLAWRAWRRSAGAVPAGGGEGVAASGTSFVSSIVGDAVDEGRRRLSEIVRDVKYKQTRAQLMDSWTQIMDGSWGKVGRQSGEVVGDDRWRARLVELERAVERMAPVVSRADAWRDDPAKGLGSHRELDLSAAVDAYRAKLSGDRPPSSGDGGGGESVGITDVQLRMLFARHCECRPLDLARSEGDHAGFHDCDTGILSDIQIALGLGGSDDVGRIRAARARCAKMLVWQRNAYGGWDVPCDDAKPDEPAHAELAKDGFHRIGRVDVTGRRSLWLREEQGAIELRAGREGCDASVRVTSEHPLFREICSVLSAARHAAEQESEDGAALEASYAVDRCPVSVHRR